MATVTKTIGTSSRDYSTIAAWEADLSSGDAYNNGDDAVGVMYADSTFTDATVTINGGASIGGSSGQDLNSITLTVVAADRHDGTKETGVLLKPTADSGHSNGIIRIASACTLTIEWLDISMDSLDSTNTNNAIRIASTPSGGGTTTTIRNMLIHDKGGNPGSDAAGGIVSSYAGATDDTWYLLNNIIYSLIETDTDSSSAMNMRAYEGNLYIYNNTIYLLKSNGASKDAVGIRFGNSGDTTAYIKNNIVAGLDGSDINAAYWQDDNSATLNSATNLSDDTADAAKDAEDFDVSANDSTALTGKTLAQIDFVSTTVGAEDLHISQSSICIDAGTDLGTAGGVDIDINGRDRDAKGDTWDIGAHEFSSAARYASPFVMFVD